MSSDLLALNFFFFFFFLILFFLLCQAFKHVHGADDLGRALESWAPRGEPLAGRVGA